MEECAKVFDKEKERLNNIITEYKEQINELENEIKELKDKLENANKTAEENIRLYEVKVSNYNDLQELYDGLEITMQENEIKLKDNIKKAKEEEFLRVKEMFVKEINGLNEIIQSIFSKDKVRFDKNLDNVSAESKNNLINWESLYKPKWG